MQRRVVGETVGGNFVVFIYEGSTEHPANSVDSYLLTETDIPRVLEWLRRRPERRPEPEPPVDPT